MQRATITIVVESDQDRFTEHESDIYWKALACLKAGKYTVDIEALDTSESHDCFIVDRELYDDAGELIPIGTKVFL